MDQSRQANPTLQRLPTENSGQPHKVALASKFDLSWPGSAKSTSGHAGQAPKVQEHQPAVPLPPSPFGREDELLKSTAGKDAEAEEEPLEVPEWPMRSPRGWEGGLREGQVPSLFGDWGCRSMKRLRHLGPFCFLACLFSYLLVCLKAGLPACLWRIPL